MDPIQATWETYLLALCIWREARGCTTAEWAGIHWVVRNRVAQQRKAYGLTLSEAIVKPYQFSSFNAGDPNSSRWPLPGMSEWPKFVEIVQALPTFTSDPTGGAVLYHSIPTGQPYPRWATADKFTCQIGPFRFYRG